MKRDRKTTLILVCMSVILSITGVGSVWMIVKTAKQIAAINYELRIVSSY